MKLAFSTLPCQDYTALQLKNLCDKHGLQGAEVRMQDDLSFQYGNGLPVTDVGSSICIREYDAALLENAKEIIRSVSEKDIRGIRVFLGNFCQRYDAVRFPLNHEGIVRMLQELCDSTDMEIWIETHNEYATGKVLAGLIKDVNRDNLKIIWDIIHPIEDGEAPDRTIAYLGEHIAHVHIKDGRKRKDAIWHDYEYTPLGEGSLPIKEIVKLLEGHGYKGYYSLEWESAWRPELKALNWGVDEILHKYVCFMSDMDVINK